MKMSEPLDIPPIETSNSSKFVLLDLSEFKRIFGDSTDDLLLYYDFNSIQHPCRQCQKFVFTNFVDVPTIKTHILGILFYLCVCCMPVLNPYSQKVWYKRKHYCKNCKNHIATQHLAFKE